VLLHLVYIQQIAASAAICAAPLGISPAPAIFLDGVHAVAAAAALGKPEKSVYRGEGKVPSSNKEGKNELLETTLHYSNTE